MRAVAAEGVWKFYGDYPALRDVILYAEPGACLALIGRNGAGKTTLLRIIAGFSKAGRGQVRIFRQRPRETETRRRVGIHRPWHFGLRRAVRPREPTLFGRLYHLPDPRKAGHGMAGAHRPRAR